MTISATGISKSFGDNHVLRDIDLAIAKGERIVIIGPSGTGKSTLLRCFNFLDRPDRGVITIGDLSVNAETASRADILALRRRTAFVFQHYALFDNKTARENVAEALLIVRGKAAMRPLPAPIRSWPRSGCRTRPMPIRRRCRAGRNSVSALAAPWRWMRS